MTVPSGFAQAYNRVIPVLERLQAKCDLLLRGVARSVEGRYYSRIKPPESLLMKIERDGPEKPFEEIEDLFAATIVVPNSTLVQRVDEGISELFEIVKMVPPKTRAPEEFIYDDRHLILKLRQEPGREDPELASIRFELQIKTEMQAAASAVSRELGYKTRWLSWAKARLASRIRALVEMADDLLARLVESLEDAKEPPEERYEMFANRNRIIQILEQTLAPEQMPEDRRRLAITVEKYLELCKPKTSPEELKQMIEDDKYAKVREAISLTAAGSVFIVLFMEGRLADNPADPLSLHGKRRYLITNEMIDFCPPLRQIPESRRVLLNPEE